jgi:FKBP-type peptidyl-prolyl cis-trans isomerase SlyD
MPQRVISFHYTLTDSTGKTLDSSDGSEPLTFLEGVQQIIPGLERELTGLKPGDKKLVTVRAADAYGDKDDKKIVDVPLTQMPTKTIKVGDQFRAGEGHQAPVVTATKVTATHVTLDANHPLAGIDLTFAIEITAVRDATAEELAHGHAHGPGGHHH